MIDLILKNTKDEIERRKLIYAKNNSVQKTDRSKVKSVFGFLF
jgi:hypothetical protein